MQGYRNILITLSFGSAVSNSNGTEATFFYRFAEWTGSEQLDKLFPVSVWIPESDAGSTVVISQAKEGQLFDVDGDLEMGDIKGDYNVYHPFIKIRAHNIYAHAAHKHFNKVTLFGKALPRLKKDGSDLFEVWASKPNRNGQSVHRMKFAVEKTSSKKQEDGSYSQSESVFFNISANADESGKGKSSSLFPYLAGQHIFATGSLSISGSKGKVYTTVFVGGYHDFLQGVLAQTKDTMEKCGIETKPVKVKTFGSDDTF
jgi:hypothetical protein